MKSCFRLAAAGLLLFALAVSQNAAQNPLLPAQRLSLRATVLSPKPFRYEYVSLREIKPYAEIRCVVQNNSGLPIAVHTSSCTWTENWSVSNPKVRIAGWSCYKNILVDLTLAPGATYTKTLPLTFVKLKAGQPVTFRVRFSSNHGDVSSKPNDTAQSGPITIRVPNAKMKMVGRGLAAARRH